MADIDTLIATGARTNANWDAIPGIAKSYWEGLDQAQKQKDRAYTEKLRGLFSDENGGIPRDASGNFDAPKAFERVISAGGVPAVDSAASLSNAGLQQDRIRFSPTVMDAINGRPSGDNLPPSPSRNGVATEPPAGAPPPVRNAAPTSPYRGGDSGTTSVVSVLTAQGISEQTLGQAAASLARQLGVDPNAPLDLDDPSVRNVLVPAIKQLKGQAAGNGQPQGQSQQPQVAQIAAPPAAPLQQPGPQQQPQIAAPPPPAAARPQPTVPLRDPTLGGLIPPGYEPGPYLQRLQLIAASGRVLPDQQKVLEQKIAAIQTALQPTPDIKNAAAAGMSVPDFLNRNDDAITQRDVLTKSILPKLDKSQETALAARDEIQAIQRSRAELDAPGGIFNGAAAEVRLKVAKVAEFLGVQNADKISNTEAFGSAIGSRVLSLVKGLGSGTGISDADRAYAAQMAGGNIKLDERSIRKILDIGERAARVRIDQHNSLADRTLKASDALKGYGDVYRVDMPGEYQRAGGIPAPKAGTFVDGHQFLGGDPKDRRSWKAM